HRPGFWDSLDARLAAGDGPAARPVSAGDGAAVPPTATVIVPPDAAPPPLAEVIPLGSARRSRQRAALAAAAAALVVVLAAATLVRTSSTDVETRPADQTTVPTDPPASVVPVPDPDPDPPASTAPTTLMTRGDVPASPPPSRPTAPSTTVRRTTTTAAAPLTLSPSGLGRLQLGMTTSQAAATGAVGPYRPSGNGECGLAQPAGSYRQGDFSALFLDGRLARIYVQGGSRLRTPQGIGYGTPSSRLREIPGTRTEAPEKYGAGIDVTIMNGGVGYVFNVQAPADDVANGVVREWSVGTRTGLALTEACS
ncbi:MAG: hypothetical protein ACLGI3_12425, partial [Actinomycetes bacterium]